MLKQIIFYPFFCVLVFVIKILDIIFGVNECRLSGVYFEDDPTQNTVRYWLTDGRER